MKAYIYTEFQSLVRNINDMELSFFKIDESYSNIKSIYESALFYCKLNNRNVKESIEDNVKSMELFSEKNQKLVEYSIVSNKKRTVKFFFILTASLQLYISYEKTKQLINSYEKSTHNNQAMS